MDSEGKKESNKDYHPSTMPTWLCLIDMNKHYVQSLASENYILASLAVAYRREKTLRTNFGQCEKG